MRRGMLEWTYYTLPLGANYTVRVEDTRYNNMCTRRARVRAHDGTDIIDIDGFTSVAKMGTGLSDR